MNKIKKFKQTKVDKETEKFLNEFMSHYYTAKELDLIQKERIMRYWEWVFGK